MAGLEGEEDMFRRRSWQFEWSSGPTVTAKGLTWCGCIASCYSNRSKVQSSFAEFSHVWSRIEQIGRETYG